MDEWLATAAQQGDVLMLPAHVIYISASVGYAFNLSQGEADRFLSSRLIWST